MVLPQSNLRSDVCHSSCDSHTKLHDAREPHFSVTMTMKMEDSIDSLIDLGQNKVFVASSLAFYLLLSKRVFAFLRDGVLNLKPNSQGLKFFVFVHNALLAVFSLVVWLATVPLFWNHLRSHGWESLHCSQSFWKDDGFGYWAHIFYLSKYYEFVDSWILVLKGKDVSFLQVYHHAGVVIAMYLGSKSEANWMVWLVVLNSFIHTLMYTYFAAATLGYRSPLAKILTSAQMIQFITGISMSSSCYFYDGCINQDQLISLVFVQVYAAGLLYLFYGMFKQKYNKNKSKKG